MTTADKKRKLTVNDIPDIDHTLGLLTEWRALPPRLNDAVVAHAGTLVYAEDAKCTYYLNPDNFKEVVENAGGKFNGSINGKTTIVVIGALEKEWSKKAADLWTGSNKELAIKKQKTGARKADNLHIVLFKDFINHFKLDYKVQRSVFTARYEGKQTAKMGPGKARSKGTIAGSTLGRDNPLDPAGKMIMVKGLYPYPGMGASAGPFFDDAWSDGEGSF